MRKVKTQKIAILLEICFFAVLIGFYPFLWPVLLFVALSYIPAKVLKK